MGRPAVLNLFGPRGGRGGGGRPAGGPHYAAAAAAPARRYAISACRVEGAAGLDVVEEYGVGGAVVRVTADGRYLVSEPAVTEETASLYELVSAKIDSGVAIEPDGDPAVLAGRFRDVFWSVARTHLADDSRIRAAAPVIDYYINRDVGGHGILDVVLKDPSIEDILCTAPGKPIRVTHQGHADRHVLVTNVQFADRDDIERFIQKVYSRTNSEPTEARPMAVTHMADGSRISCTYGTDISVAGPTLAIRRFPSKPHTIAGMLRNGTLTAEMAAYLWTLLAAKGSGLVTGATGGGKTSLLGALTSMLHPAWRVTTIEDTLELSIPHQDWVRLNTRRSHGMARGYDVTVRDLIDVSLTQRPDYEIVGEIRLKDAGALFQSIGTGHGGLTSYHASGAEGALTRMRGEGVTEGELALLWFCVHVAKVRVGAGGWGRRVTDISELAVRRGGGGAWAVGARQVYGYDRLAGRFVRRLDPAGSERYAEALEACGIADGEADMRRRAGLLAEAAGLPDPSVGEVFAVLGRYYAP